jgi:hypothetical protein
MASIPDVISDSKGKIRDLEKVHCWGSGPAHVRVSGPLCELEGLFVNTASTRGSEENNH